MKPPDQGSLFPVGPVMRPSPPPARRLAPGHNQPALDLVMTPPELARRIVDDFQPRGRLLDPCRGQGAFFNAMQRHSADVAWCEISEGIDFFAHATRADWIITNPPWSVFRPFLRHAMRLAPNVVFLATITHFVTKARLREIHSAGFGVARMMLVDQPPKPWPGSGFQLAAVLIQRGAPCVFETTRHPLPMEVTSI